MVGVVGCVVSVQRAEKLLDADFLTRRDLGQEAKDVGLRNDNVVFVNSACRGRTDWLFVSGQILSRMDGKWH